VRLYNRNAYDWTARLAAIAAAAELIKAKSCTIDGEAVVVGLTACHGLRSACHRAFAQGT
jgi:ATP-dependent DNA ligase